MAYNNSVFTRKQVNYETSDHTFSIFHATSSLLVVSVYSCSSDRLAVFIFDGEYDRARHLLLSFFQLTRGHCYMFSAARKSVLKLRAILS